MRGLPPRPSFRTPPEFPHALRVPQPLTPSAAEPGTVYTVANGDLRPAANVTGWPSQQKLEADLAAALTDLGRTVRRAHDVDETKGHGFIDSQCAGDRGLQATAAGRPADRRRRGLAVQPLRARGTAQPPGPDTRRRQPIHALGSVVPDP